MYRRLRLILCTRLNIVERRVDEITEALQPPTFRVVILLS